MYNSKTIAASNVLHSIFAFVVINCSKIVAFITVIFTTVRKKSFELNGIVSGSVRFKYLFIL